MKQYDIDDKKATQYLDYLERKYTEWYVHPKKKDRTRIENEVRSMADHWDDSIYIWLNEGKASGLFEPGFFETDIMRSMQMLGKIVRG